MEAQYNLRSPAVKRLMKEAQELREPTEQFYAQPLDDNLFEWHFTIRGPVDSEFDGGVYHGRIILPPEYPMKPPSIILLTPNGRFETHKKICLSISGYHPESWQPSWSLRTALLAIIGFMPTHGNGAIGSLDYSPDERKALAKKSVDWKCEQCGPIRNLLRPVTEASDALNKEAKELGSQIKLQGEKEKSPEGSTSTSSTSAVASDSDSPVTVSSPVQSAPNSGVPYPPSLPHPAASGAAGPIPNVFQYPQFPPFMLPPGHLPPFIPPPVGMPSSWPAPPPFPMTWPPFPPQSMYGMPNPLGAMPFVAPFRLPTQMMQVPLTVPTPAQSTGVITSPPQVPTPAPSTGVTTSSAQVPKPAQLTGVTTSPASVSTPAQSIGAIQRTPVSVVTQSVSMNSSVSSTQTASAATLSSTSQVISSTRTEPTSSVSNTATVASQNSSSQVDSSQSSAQVDSSSSPTDTAPTLVDDDPVLSANEIRRRRLNTVNTVNTGAGSHVGVQSAELPAVRARQTGSSSTSWLVNIVLVLLVLCIVILLSRRLYLLGTRW